MKGPIKAWVREFRGGPDLGVDHRELLERCDSLSIDVRNYMSVLNDEDEHKLRGSFSSTKKVVEQVQAPGVVRRRRRVATTESAGRPGVLRVRRNAETPKAPEPAAKPVEEAAPDAQASAPATKPEPVSTEPEAPVTPPSPVVENDTQTAPAEAPAKAETEPVSEATADNEKPVTEEKRWSSLRRRLLSPRRSQRPHPRLNQQGEHESLAQFLSSSYSVERSDHNLALFGICLRGSERAATEAKAMTVQPQAVQPGQRCSRTICHSSNRDGSSASAHRRRRC